MEALNIMYIKMCFVHYDRIIGHSFYLTCHFCNIEHGRWPASSNDNLVVV